MLFGHQSDNDTTQMPGGTVTEPSGPPPQNPLTSDLQTGTDTAMASDTTNSDDTTEASVNQASSAAESDNPLADETIPTATASPAPDSSTQESTDTAPSGDLLELKQQALSHLTPLVDHLDQSPEEKFRTTMMMIQSTDNESLLKEAFEAAKTIPDDKARAQALLDVINEINYFTQKKSS